MQQYRMTDQGWALIKKRMWARVVPMLIVLIAVMMVVLYVNQPPEKDDLTTLLVIIPIILLALGAGLYRGLLRQKKLMDSYVLTLTGNLLTQEQANTQEVAIYYNEVEEVVQYKNNGLYIRGAMPAEAIMVPPGIERYDELVANLQAIKPFVTPSQSSYQKTQVLTTVLTFVSLIVVYVASNKIAVAIAGPASIGLLIRSLYLIQSSKTVDEKTKKSLWMLSIVIVSVGMMVYYKLMR